MHPELPRPMFPDPRLAPADAPLAFGGNLHPLRLLAAYKQGIFPWYNPGEPTLWWSPDPRFVLYLNNFHAPHGLKRAISAKNWKVTADKAFGEVIRACSSIPRKEQDGTWITDDMVNAYESLHEMGYAHSIEVWLDEQLVGGLYGVSLGAAFFGESMFHRVSNASKVALYHLVENMIDWRFHFIDCQVPTDHLLTLGASEVPRRIFLQDLKNTLKRKTLRGNWTLGGKKPIIKSSKKHEFQPASD